MSVSSRAMQFIKDRRARSLAGLYNSLPLPFKRFRTYFPGIEKAKYYLVTANQKIGKSKFTDNIFVYEPFFQMMKDREKLSLKIIYFTLEMSKQEKMLEFLSHLLYRLSNGRIRMSPKDLKSTDNDHPVPQEILDLLETEEYQRYITAFEETVEYIDNIKNPTGINKYVRAYALDPANGKLHMKTVTKKNELGIEETFEVPDYYEPTDPEEMRIIVLDNASNLVLESDNGVKLNKMETIDKMSKYFITLRDQLQFTICLIQHQNQAQEGVENVKLDMIKPSANGLAECKTTIRDVNTAIGLYSPAKYGRKEFAGYDITKFGKTFTAMEIIEDRDNGAGNMICPLYFDGAVSYFRELPKKDDHEELNIFYNVIAQNKAIQSR